jgi:hypothetical protein
MKNMRKIGTITLFIDKEEYERDAGHKLTAKRLHDIGEDIKDDAAGVFGFGSWQAGWVYQPEPYTPPSVDTASQEAMAMGGIHHVKLSERLHLGESKRISGIVSDDITGQEYDAVYRDGSWYMSDDDGDRHYGATITEAIVATRINIDEKDNN